MNREEYLARLASEPATANQRGAIMSEFARLGFHRRRDRAERLAACAALLGLDELNSTANLTQGQAGQLVNALQRITDRAELARAAALPGAGDSEPGEHQDHVDEPGDTRPPVTGQMTWPQVLIRLMAVIYAAVRGNTAPPGDQEPPG